jgi:enhancing lycopene biosynthesis protein 2
VVDEKLKLVTSPAYMLAGRISEVADGIDGCVDAVIKLM